MNIPYISDSLHHFVGWRNPDADEENWRTLQLVLNAQCVSHPPHDVGYGPTRLNIDLDGVLEDESLLVPSVTCYADIPAGSLGQHVQKYGRFGVSFRRDFLIRQGARPVMYVPMVSERWPFGPPHNGKNLLDDITAVYRGFDEFFEARFDGAEPSARSMGVKPVTEVEVLSGVKSILELSLLAFLKPFDANLPSDHRDCYYMEREWRILGNLPFKLHHIERVWVASGYATEVERRFPSLASRITEIPCAT